MVTLLILEEKLNEHYFSGLMAPLDKNNVDTDQIIPKQFLTSTSREGFDAALFYDWRYLDNGEPNPDFILNRPATKARKYY